MEDVLELLKDVGIEAEKDGYITLPREHCFAAWRIAHRKAQGADGYALYWDVTYELRLCYRDGKTADDLKREKILEKKFRELEDLESDYDYDANDKLDITVYKFTGTEEF
ncbi:MAG: hypothetical protein NC253_02935 [Ruminococcus sp.]|nr:hypothetical protein [Ruminococcus sp.]MCM1380350.1 hypothetical protein [Muribaculaceae bacterium]MCM1478340.1 hypothetical protein [Muribaculaceae bacterium]